MPLPPLAAIEPKYCARDEYIRLHEEGTWTSDDKLQLLRGEVRRTPRKLHVRALTICQAREVLQRVVPPSFLVVQHMSFSLNQNDLSEVDLCVVDGPIGRYVDDFPTSAHVLIEIVDDETRADISMKTAIYAETGIADFWTIDVTTRTLTTHRKPEALVGGRKEFHFQDVRRFAENDSVRPLFMDSAISVKDLLLQGLRTI